jgi:hypothetical protein
MIVGRGVSGQGFMFQLGPRPQNLLLKLLLLVV